LRCADCMCEISSFGLRRIGMGLLLIEQGVPSHCAGPVGRGGGVGPAGRALPCWGALALPPVSTAHRIPLEYLRSSTAGLFAAAEGVAAPASRVGGTRP
jgi:hypothetical protein